MVYDNHSSIEKWFMIIMHIEVYDNPLLNSNLEVYDNPLLLSSKCGFMMILLIKDNEFNSAAPPRC